MLERNLIKQLSQLKEIKPDADWKVRNRDILVKQIYGSQPEQEIDQNSWTWYWHAPLALASSISQPAWVAILIFIFLIGGGATSVKMAEQTKPGDSLYIAKLISERTQLALTFNDASKARLGLQFASNRVDEINQVLAQPAASSKDQNVADLLDNLKNQISNVRSSIAKISPTAAPANNLINVDKKEDSASQMVISADLKKENKGIDISDGSAAPASEQEAPKLTVPATTTVTNTIAATSSTATLNINQTADILKQAEQLLDQNKYNDTLLKLNEADKSISPADNGSSTTAITK